MCSRGAPEAEALRRAGLVEGSPNVHPGQGTACRRFFFENAYLELLWVDDEEQARSEPVLATRLWERWSERGAGASPFGIVVRPAIAEMTATSPPFPAWAYTPRYLPSGMAIGVAIDTPLEEPEFFHLGFQRDRSRGSREPAAHRIPVKLVDRVIIGCPEAPRSDAAKAMQRCGWLSFEQSSDHVLRLAFDSEEPHGIADIRPDLPVVLSW